jgi:glycosyltransferase involved in cell wall biosynthesis
MRPKVSVIIPTYNRTRLLYSAIKSVLNQTFEDFEVIVVDDASADSTRQVVGKFKDRRIRYIRHKENKGGSAARNTGIKGSKGKFIAFLDDDDMWMPSKLEKQVDLISKNLEIGAVYTGVYIINKSDKIIWCDFPLLKGNIFPIILKKNYVGSCSQVLVRKECFDRVGLFDESLSAGQDWDMWIRLAKHYQFDYVNETLVLYRVHEKRISTNPYAKLQAAKLLFEKFSAELKRSENTRAVGYWHYEFGKLYCECKNMRKGREEFTKAIEVNPRSVMCYLHLFASFFGLTIYNALRRLPQSLLPESFKSKIA